MKVLIDGQEVECKNDVKIIWDGEEAPEDDMQFHMTVTHEGIILDSFIVQNDSDETDLCLDKTMSVDVEYLRSLCI